MEIENLFRESLKKYAVYEPVERLNEEEWIIFNTNENPYPPIPDILEDIKKAIDNSENLNKYPDPLALELRKAILNQLLRDKNTLTNRNTIFIGNGADEIFDTIFKVFIDPEDEIVVFYPTYGIYKVLANLYNAKIKEIKLTEDFSIPDEFFNVNSKLIFINSPNDPNGKSFDNEIIEKICKSCSGIVVVDETYADFGEKTCLSLLKSLDNLIVCRSFSIGFSMASLRIGYALADAKIIKEMNRVKLPFNTSYISQIAALSCIKHRNKVYEQNKKIKSERARLTNELSKYKGISVLPSDANFIFIRYEDQAKTLKFLWDLKELKIIVKHFSMPNLYNYLRITISTAENNNKFLTAFQDIAKKYL
jgi:histidinol-phosphate aminotransferase